MFEGCFRDDLHFHRHLEDAAGQPGDSPDGAGVEVLLASALPGRGHPVIELLDGGHGHLVHGHIPQKGQNVQLQVQPVIGDGFRGQPGHEGGGVGFLHKLAHRGRFVDTCLSHGVRRNHQPRRNGLPQVIVEDFLLGFPGEPNALIADLCALSDSFLGHVECSLRHIRPVGCGVFKVGGSRLFPVGRRGVSFAHGLRRKLYHTMVMQCNLTSFAYRS